MKPHPPDYQESEPEDPSDNHTHQTAEIHTSVSHPHQHKLHHHQHKHHQHHSTTSTSAPMARTQPIRLRREPPIPKRLSLPTASSSVSSNTPTTAGVKMTNYCSTPEFATYENHLGTPVEFRPPAKIESSPLLGSSRLQYPTSNPARSTRFNRANHSSSTLETMPEATTDLSPSSEKGDGVGNMFELFRTFDGEEYTVYVREDGKKFYVDWEEQVRASSVSCLSLSLIPSSNPQRTWSGVWE